MRCVALLAVVCLAACAEEKTPPEFRTEVNEVVVSFVVKDSSGKNIRDLNQQDFRVLENGVEQEIVEYSGIFDQQFPGSIYLLMDSSSISYPGYVYMVEAARNFVRQLPPDTALAVYSFSRNLHRVLTLTRDRVAQLEAVATPEVGDDPALYNALLLTLRDAEKQPGTRAIVAFTNRGTDYASMISPDDVARVAQNNGVSIHVIAGGQPPETATPGFVRVTRKTGGAFYTVSNWQSSKTLFGRVEDDLTNRYTVAYRSQTPRDGKYRRIVIAVKDRSHRVVAREGYTAPQGDSAILTALQRPPSE